MQHGFVKVAAGTPSVRVADCACNGEHTARMVLDAAQQGVKILVLPELGLTAYTCGDLFLQKTLLQGAQTALQTLLDRTAHTEVLLFAGLLVAFVLADVPPVEVLLLFFVLLCFVLLFDVFDVFSTGSTPVLLPPLASEALVDFVSLSFSKTGSKVTWPSMRRSVGSFT